MAFLNADISNSVTYTGTNELGSYNGPDNKSYTFYYGTITLTISSFDDVEGSYLNFASYNNGYMGGQNVIKIVDNAFYNVMTNNISNTKQVPLVHTLIFQKVICLFTGRIRGK